MSILGFLSKKKINELGLAYAFWNPTNREARAFKDHSCAKGIDHVDQIWLFLKNHYGKIKAIEAPHVRCPETYSYEQLADKISQAAAAFRSLGIQRGDVVALFSENSPRWLIVDQGLMRVGAVDAVRGVSAPENELRYILENSSAIALIVQTVQLWEKLDLKEEQKKKLKFILVLEDDPTASLLGWDDFCRKAQNEEPIEATYNLDSAASSDSEIATILYTSGTTGTPKGVPLTHANLLHQIRSLACIANPFPGTPLLSVLPIWHSYERSAEYYFFSCACTQHYTSIKYLKQDLERVRPVVMATVPRLWESVKTGFDEVVKKMPQSRQKLLKIAIKNSGAYKLALRKFRNLLIVKVKLKDRVFACGEMVFRWPIHSLSSLLLWPKILERLCGGRLLFPINGGGAIAPHVDQFFEALGIELLVGYGLTETSPVLSCRRPWKNIRGTSGPPLPETEFQIIDPEDGKPLDFYQKGVVLAKGPQVMKGYLNNPGATKKVLDENGWFNTGDLGMLLPDGSIVLTGRAKDTIVLSNGENVEPGPLEEALLATSFIEQIMMVGQDQKQLGALLVPNFEQMLVWARKQQIVLSKDLGGYPGNENLRKALRREINYLLAARPGSRSDERVAGVALVQAFTIENGLLTQTLKQRREKISERDKSAIASIYA